MSILKVLQFPHENLRLKAKAVDKVDANIQQLADDMLETMYAENGVGLAAVQVDVRQRVIVIDISESRDQPLILINPEIIAHQGEQMNEEGCLSVPGFFAKVDRYEKITFTALDRQGNAFEQSADGLLSICIQHEIDHLNGKLFVDYLSKLKRDRIRKKLEKQQRVTM